MTDGDVVMYLLAEYCAAELYTGWHLYEREHNDGRPNSGWDRWGWLRRQTEKVRELCVEMGHQPPPAGEEAFAEWFAGTFPNGLRVAEKEAGGYQLMEILKTRPRQPRGVIRTIAGAKCAEAARRKRGQS